MLAHGEIETVRHAVIGDARGKAQDGESARVVPAAQHVIDGAREETHYGVTFQRAIEIEAGGDAEAFQRGAQRGHVDIGSAHDDAHFAERASRAGLLKNASGDLLDFAFDARRLDQRQRGLGAPGRHAFLRDAHSSEAHAQGGREIFVAEGEGEVGVPAQSGHHAQFGVGQGVKAIDTDGRDPIQSLGGDLRGGKFQTACAHGQSAAG